MRHQYPEWYLLDLSTRITTTPQNNPYSRERRSVSSRELSGAAPLSDRGRARCSHAGYGRFADSVALKKEGPGEKTG
jgi:hypothetical protein